MDTRKLDPLNQLDDLTIRLSRRWEQFEGAYSWAFYFRRAIGWVCYALFVPWAAWMIGALFGIWPDTYAAYTPFAWTMWALAVPLVLFGEWGMED